MDIDASSILQEQRQQAASQLSGYFDQFQTLYDQKLWHQLTTQVEKLFDEPSAASVLLGIYSQFVSLWERKMSPMALVRIAIKASRQVKELSEAISLLEQVLEKVGGEKDLAVMVRMEIAHYRLRLGDLVQPKRAIEECRQTIEGLSFIDPSVHAVFYRVCADFDKATGAFSSFYKNGLLFLACVRLEDLSLERQTELAHDLCVSALVGERTFNFGELLMHPVLAVLAGTPFEYLSAALVAFNGGNHDQFASLLPAISVHPILSSKIDFLRQKICLMSLVELVFCHLKQSRRVPFAAIAAATRVPPEQVEFLVMKALSVSLIRGSIDEVDRVVAVEWVQPRVLDRSQIAELQAAIKIWKDRVSETSQLIDNLVPICD